MRDARPITEGQLSTTGYVCQQPFTVHKTDVTSGPFNNSVRKQVSRLLLRQAIAAMAGLMIGGLLVIGGVELFHGKITTLAVAVLFTALWWRFLLPMWKTPRYLTCPSCGIKANLTKRRADTGDVWRLVCSGCGARGESSLGDTGWI
jgi:hypothetical protein